jgi:hypothetical protein
VTARSARLFREDVILPGVTAHGRFFDADADRPDQPPRIVLERHELDGVERFQVLRRFGYLDTHHPEPFIVPADVDGFRSDLTSVPTVFAWLVPRTGNHLPAALLHDGLVYEPNEPCSYIGPAIDREEADRIFRDAMRDLGTGFIRRWLLWTAVTLATALAVLRPRWRWIAVVSGSLGAVAVLGVLATLDLFDVLDVLPWMAHRAWWEELLFGAAMAVVVPSVLAVLWGRLWRAGLIAGVALAVLLHVTLAVAALTGLYQLVERAPRTDPRAAR